jgi:hypothetical protein
MNISFDEYVKHREKIIREQRGIDGLPIGWRLVPDGHCSECDGKGVKDFGNNIYQECSRCRGTGIE